MFLGSEALRKAGMRTVGGKEVAVAVVPAVRPLFSFHDRMAASSPQEIAVPLVRPLLSFQDRMAASSPHTLSSSPLRYISLKSDQIMGKAIRASLVIQPTK